MNFLANNIYGIDVVTQTGQCIMKMNLYVFCLILGHCHKGFLYYGLTVASPYVGMTRKQYGSFNQCVSVYMAILSPGNKC